MIKPDEGLTSESLYGSWSFMTLEFNGKITYCYDSAPNRNYDFVTLDFYNVTWNFWLGNNYALEHLMCGYW